MKPVGLNRRGHVFRLSPRERALLFETIKLYPLVPATHQRLSKTREDERADEDQQMLEAALAEQRKENQRLVLELLSKPRFRRKGKAYEITLKRSEVDWLLQVLNDVQVGSWVMLGEPEQDETPVVTEETLKYYAALRLCQMFESALLDALGMKESAKWADA